MVRLRCSASVSFQPHFLSKTNCPFSFSGLLLVIVDLHFVKKTSGPFRPPPFRQAENHWAGSPCKALVTKGTDFLTYCTAHAAQRKQGKTASRLPGPRLSENKRTVVRHWRQRRTPPCSSATSCAAAAAVVPSGSEKHVI